MQYGITKLLIGSNNCLDISQEEFEEAKIAKHSLVEVLSIEEKHNLILDNYAEYESELLGLGLKRMLFSDRNWSSFESEIHIVGRRLINLLTTCRLISRSGSSQFELNLWKERRKDGGLKSA